MNSKVYKGNIITLVREINVPNKKYYTNTYLTKRDAILYRKDNGRYIDIDTNIIYDCYDKGTERPINIPFIDNDSLKRVNVDSTIDTKMNRIGFRLRLLK